MSFKKYLSSRKFRYGSVAIIFTAVFIVVVFLLNVLLTFIGRENSLYADLTKEEFYTVSEASKSQLKDIKEPVEIVFFRKKSDIGEPGTDPLGYVKYLAEEYAKNFGYITVKYVDMPKSPALANSYKSSTNDTIKTTSVVISCPSTGKKKIVQDKGFFTFKDDGSIYGFNGEKRITSCILQVTSTEKLKAYFTTGHNEYLSGTMANLLAEQGYELSVIDLSTSDIPKDASLLIINHPTKDFAGIKAQNDGAANEIEKLKSFIQDDYGDVILALPAIRADRSGTTPDLPELRELMEENFGISYVPESVVADTSANSIDTEGLMLVAKPAGDADSFEYQMHKSVTEKGIKIIAPYCLPLKIIGGTDKYTAPVLVSSESSIMQEANAASAVNVPASPLAVVSSKIYYDSEQQEKRGTLFVTGSLMFEFVTNDSYGNADFFYGVLRSLGNTTVSVDIPTKPFDDTYLDITKKNSTATAILITLILPVIPLVLGMVIWIRRKRK